MRFSIFQSQNEQDYTLFARLQGSQGPINSLAFTNDGEFLASGGDDEAVRIWDVKEKCSCQVLRDRAERWGQVTCVKWLSGLSEEGNSIVFGTGRGLVILYQHVEEMLAFKELSQTDVFAFNEPVETMDYDPYKSRLVVCSHFGKIRMFSVEKNGLLSEIWQNDMNNLHDEKGVIPRVAKFVGRGEHIIIFGLESGTIMSRAAATGTGNWSKTLSSGIGNASLSPDEQWLLVDNLAKGFDLYSYPRLSLSKCLLVERQRAYVHDGLFLESGQAICRGSDHGEIYIFSLQQDKFVQTLQHGSSKSMIQVLDACRTNCQHLIASGCSDQNATIYIWEKKIKRAQHQDPRSCHNVMAIVILNIVLTLAFTLGSRMINIEKALPFSSLLVQRRDYDDVTLAKDAKP